VAVFSFDIVGSAQQWIAQQVGSQLVSGIVSWFDALHITAIGLIVVGLLLLFPGRSVVRASTSMAAMLIAFALIAAGTAELVLSFMGYNVLAWM
jgi:hypothetical protein